VLALTGPLGRLRCLRRAEFLALARYPGAVDWSGRCVWGYLLSLLAFLVLGLAGVINTLVAEARPVRPVAPPPPAGH
jgi:hypothetical protein